MKILAIETSCDETAIAIIEIGGSRKKPQLSILSNIVSSQIKLHAKYGGVVPNLAKREHQRNLVPILLKSLKESGLLNSKLQNTNQKQNPKSKTQKIDRILEREPDLLKKFKRSVIPLKSPHVDAIAVTHGPGLAPALWVGINFAKALSYIWDKPLIPVNHMAGHAYSAFLQKENNGKWRIINIKFPAVALLVSGGHTELVLMRKNGKFKIIGETLDDAAGEAFDKVARILGLGYPGGPKISRLADKFRNKRSGERIRLPRPMINSKDYNFSFSGLKTAVLYLTRDLGKTKTQKFCAEIAKEFQDAVVEVLVKKTIRAAGDGKVKTIILGGGVAANKELREKLGSEVSKNLNSRLLLPDPSLTGDNALMIALATYFVAKPGSNSSAAAKGGKTRSGRRLLPGYKKARDTLRAEPNVRLGN